MSLKEGVKTGYLKQRGLSEGKTGHQIDREVPMMMIKDEGFIHYGKTGHQGDREVPILMTKDEGIIH